MHRYIVRFGFEMFQHLERITQRHELMVRMLFQITIVESTAVAHAMAFRVKGEAGHQDECVFIVCFRLIEGRLP